MFELWSRLSQAELNWLRGCGQGEKSRRKAEYISLRKDFDRKVQRSKRLYWFSLPAQLENECNIEQYNFWKSIGRIGVNNFKRNNVPLEVIGQDGCIMTSIDAILNGWRTYFNNLLYCNPSL